MGRNDFRFCDVEFQKDIPFKQLKVRGLRKYICNGVRDWGITSIEVVIQAQIENKKVPMSRGCLKSVKAGESKLEPWRKTT